MAALGRSGSSGSLRFVGEQVSHIPKRATQHGVFLSTCEVPPTTLKPGQTQLDRQLYTEEAKPLEKNYIADDLPGASVYGGSLSGNAQTDHYLNPTRPIKPEEPAEDALGHQGTAHWRSESQSSLNEAAIAGARYHRQHLPSYQAANPPTCVGSAVIQGSYHEHFGKPGHDPRHRIGANDSKMPVFKTDLTRGTTKATNHIPGYQGFLATNTTNPKVAAIEQGSKYRNAHEKHVLVEQFHTNLLNYCGHVPANANNDNGGHSTTTLSTMGASFRQPLSHVTR